VINNGPNCLSYNRIRGHTIHFDAPATIQMAAAGCIVGKIDVGVLGI
jgi:hypothetical protein